MMPGGSILVLSWALASHPPTSPRSVNYWSDPATWHGHVPQKGEDVVVPQGEAVVLDTSPPALRALDIKGRLEFANDKEIKLVTSQIEVEGTLQIGTHESPFLGKASITLTDGGAKSIDVVKGGILEMHGARPSDDWLHLSETAKAGCTSIRLERKVDWKAGRHVVVASTDFDAHQAEEVVLTKVKGSELHFSPALKYMHYGRVVEGGVDERAEVGLLTRNILIQGDQASSSDGQGGEIMVMAGGKAHLESVELTRMGKLGKKGHYPIHFHLVGNASGMYVEHCAVHRCYNRCITIHGTSRLLVSSNVAFDTIGHCYFLEDGNETKNVLENNLGILTRRAEEGRQVLDSDLVPATFWITNPDNDLHGNVAAGSDRYGFWFAMPEHPTGFAASHENDKKMWLRRTPLGEFSANTAHSNSDSGLFVDPGPGRPGLSGAPYEPHLHPIPGDRIDRPAVAVFEALTSYKNRKRGIWIRGSHIEVVDAKLADNCTGVTLACSHSLMKDSAIVGESKNLGTPGLGEPTGEKGRGLPKPYSPTSPLYGYEINEGPVKVISIQFINFEPNMLRQASSIGYQRFAPYNPGNEARKLTFRHATRAPMFTEKSARKRIKSPHPAMLIDEDGSLTGGAGTYVWVRCSRKSRG